ncbi:TRAP-type C4-dicarboxylate transport system, large permease component [Aequoribacter fuscus]|jgi:tripartite ATP-independent transporter DctM subunit|uniref:TRAP transporter large permease protein n=1 Tax=Aequoribacter fuscus TaxID=2518989 RepID=F3KZ85_9GAMM|nr:TRAP transporter large permease subunit [Aequoribacter fuscus]EGG30572.1 TRAP-type C4-dicarboxylate transport system, large permease component [Aequoribacter fuscus]QHJ87470.1 TRAP transporter large permease subunit [Aequoribacter fuscus]
MAELVLGLIFVVLLCVGVPVAFCIGLATMAALLISIDTLPALTTMAQRMAGGLNSFSLLAVPLFILSGVIMGQGGIARRLIAFAKCLVGMVPGGLALVNVVSCTLFGSISGSAVAASSAVGGFMLPEMEKDGFDKNFGAAVTATAATTGLLIPPSNILIVYAIASGGVSIAALFLAGYLPGLLLASALMLVAYIHAKRHNLPSAGTVSLGYTLRAALDAAPSLFLVVIVIGGIIGGVFTATEAGAIAVVYSLVLAGPIYKEITRTQWFAVFLKATETTAIVMFLVASSVAMSWLLAFNNIPTQVAEALLAVSDNPLIILLIINLVLLLVGSFMDMTPAVLIFTPIFLPAAVEMGITPLHFGIIMVLNLSIGLCTPPVGSVLFVSCAVAKTSIHNIIRPLLPMYAAMLVVLLLVTYIPGISEALPKALGLMAK